jgi:hypothetical protein
MGGDRILGSYGSPDCIVGPREREEECVTLVTHLVPTSLLEGGAQEPMVLL